MMKAMVLHAPHSPLVLEDLPIPEPTSTQIQIRVSACGVCRTDLHIVDGELSEPVLPLVPGHQIVGTVSEIGDGVSSFRIGDRVGVPWLGGTCARCYYCRHGMENLCDQPTFTGYQRNGGFGEYVVAESEYSFLLPAMMSDTEVAPLLCAGLIGYRSLQMAGSGKRIGFYGFGAAAHILAQVVVHERRELYAFTRKGDQGAQALARELGATWAGDSETPCPQSLDSAILFAPVGDLVPTALRSVRKGGRVVCAGIHMSDIPSFPYQILWGEREIRSVANLTRKDAASFLELAPRIPVKTAVTSFPLQQANQALEYLRSGAVSGAVVLTIA